tara:strand:- start:208443 stop:208925 length:483 start_codon:yes stop_codon:yes gene_type:complete
MHCKELGLTSNTSSLALKSLESSELALRGKNGVEFDFSIKEGYQPLFLYPSDDAQELNEEFVSSLDKPVQLVVPDATWRQARKFHKREKVLSSIPAVKLKGPFESIYTLRKAPDENSVCTLEAIAYAFGILEGEESKNKLLALLKVMNERVEISRNPSLW